MSTLLQDAVYAFRLFARRPAMTAVAVLSLALATGPNAALFSLINTLFLQDIGLADPGRLVGIESSARGGVTYPDYADIAGQATAFSHVVAWMRKLAPVSAGGYEELAPANAVSANYFDGLGVRPALGRVFSPELDDRPAPEPGVVISHSFWQRRFGGRAGAIGQVFQINRRNAVVAGVAPAGFRGMDFQLPVDVWVPFSALETLRMGNRGWFQARDRGSFEIVVGRLRPGAGLEQARAELNGIGQRLAAAYPATNRKTTFNGFSITKRRAFVALLLGGTVLGLVSLVLLIACANVAGLLLALAAERRREVAVRLSLGAGRWRLIRQFLTESVLLALMGSAAGLLLGYWLLRLPLKPPMPASIDFGVRMDFHVFAYAVGLSFVAAIFFGLLPALKASRYDVVGALKSVCGDKPRRVRWLTIRNTLVVAQIAIAQFLLAGTALWVRSYMNIGALPVGFDPNRKVLFAHLGSSGASSSRVGPGGLQDLLERLRAVPGVLDVSGASIIPLSGSGGGATQKVALPGEAEPVAVRNNFVAPRYFSVIGTRLLRGRDFDARDAAGRTAVIVNEALARRIAPGADAVGRWLRVEGADREVIGVVENGKYVRLRDPEQPYLYLPTATPGILAIATAGDSQALAEAVRRTVSECVPELRVLNLTTLRENMRFATYIDSAAAGLFAVLGLLGIFLAAVGLYGVIAHAVSRRKQEIGVRVALGAEPGSIVRMVLGQGLRLAMVGVPLGLAGAIAGSIAVSSLLFGVKPYDPVSYLAGALGVAGVALLASHFPARRATRIQPSDALRAE